MEENTKKKISRRDAMKLLAAAVGAATVANLPSEWNQPALAASELPEHARQSVITSIRAGADQLLNACHVNLTSTACISPAKSGVVLRYTISVTGGTKVATPVSSTRTTDASGCVSLDITGTGLYLGSLSVTWTFDDPADGSGSATQMFNTHPEWGC